MSQITYLEAIRCAMREEMKRDKNVFLMGEDIGIYGGAFRATEGLYKEFGKERVIDTPISESAIVGAAIGASLLGMRPVVEMQFADFISCAFDQIVNQAATMRYRHGGKISVPIVIRGPSGAGIHGAIFHSQSPEAWFIHTPGLKVVVPSTPYDAKGLLKASIRDDNPVIYLEHKYLYRRIKEEVPKEDFIIPLGKGDIKRKGDDITLITYGAMVHIALEASDILQKAGIETEVIDLRTLSPLDKEMIKKSVSKTSKVLILQEDKKTLGIASEISAFLAEEFFEELDGPIIRVTSPDTHVPFSPPLEEFYLPDVKKTVDAVKKLAAY
ncbi:MAG TPA: alpha-ketoacid dehydrogenase subunit beta [Nitrospinota bacterium]|nr:alpha-ketoacid dehydrogenase subunit beta [Nitrospinota bacterium]